MEKAFPQEKVGLYQAMQHNTLRCKGMTWHLQKSPSTASTDKHFLWFLLKEEKAKEHIKSSTQGAGTMREQRVLHRNYTVLHQVGEAEHKAHSGGPTFHPTGLLQECVCSAMPFDKGEDAATCPHLSEPIFWPRFMSKTWTSHCCVLILVYSKASQPSGFKEKR